MKVQNFHMVCSHLLTEHFMTTSFFIFTLFKASVTLLGLHNWRALNTDEMVLYESAKVPHSQQSPFNRTFYNNFFVHFYPL
jgi:hypothetical protein